MEDREIETSITKMLKATRFNKTKGSNGIMQVVFHTRLTITQVVFHTRLIIMQVVFHT